MAGFTIERRTFLQGAILAPLAAMLPAAEASRRWNEFVISWSEEGRQLSIVLTKEGEVDEVTYSTGEQKFRMTEGPSEDQGGVRWRTFAFKKHPHAAEIWFRVVDASTIEVERVAMTEVLIA